MKLTYYVLAMLLLCSAGYPQDTTVLLTTSMFEKSREQIFIGSLDGWIFNKGNDSTWANRDINLSGWKQIKPSQLSADMADNGKVEGWFRIKVKLDSSFNGMKVGFRVGRWAAIDLYVDGRKIASYGDTRESSYTENRVNFDSPADADLIPGEVHLIALHVFDYLSPFHINKLKLENADNALRDFIRLTGPNYMKQTVSFVQKISNYSTLWISVMGLLSILFWLLYFQNSDQRNMRLIAMYTTAGALNIFFFVYAESFWGSSFTAYSLSSYAANIFGSLSLLLVPVLLVNIFNRSTSTIFKGFLVLLSIFCALNIILFEGKLQALVGGVVIAVSGYYVFSSWKNLKGAQWYVVAGLFVFLFFSLLYGISYAIHHSLLFPFAYVYATAIYLSMPVFLMVYVSARYREIITDVRDQAAQVLQLSEEKKALALSQKELLEKEVARQTIELRESLAHLKATQSQLIQSEKMASLGELTAGIAHEIQNPLNFVNNFSEVSNELLVEMKEEIEKGNVDEVKVIAQDVIQNLEKILHHGKRADGIVKGMLQHSRSGSGIKEPTDINALADEYLRLAYHGLRAKDKSFNAKFETHFDAMLEKIEVVPQDIGRVILNLITNAFYAVTEKRKTESGKYEPTVKVSTKKVEGNVLISVTDNGNGIPKHIKEKIFQPFFTTKPTGQGTGLGLSLAYDIVKAHGGELKVETREGEGSEFSIQLPIF